MSNVYGRRSTEFRPAGQGLRGDSPRSGRLPFPRVTAQRRSSGQMPPLICRMTTPCHSSLHFARKRALRVLAAECNCRIHSRGAPYGYATRQCGDASKQQ